MATYALVALLTERSDQLPACETASKAHGVEGEGGQGGPLAARGVLVEGRMQY